MLYRVCVYMSIMVCWSACNATNSMAKERKWGKKRLPWKLHFAHQLYTNKNNNPLLFYCVRGLSGHYSRHIARLFWARNENGWFLLEGRKKKLRNSRKTKTTELKTERGKNATNVFAAWFIGNRPYHIPIIVSCSSPVVHLVRSLYLYAYLSAIHHLSHHIWMLHCFLHC